MTISEFESRKFVGQDSLVGVRNHKSRFTHGLAHLKLSPELDKQMTLYLNSTSRPSPKTELDPEHETVFLTWKGKAPTR